MTKTRTRGGGVQPAACVVEMVRGHIDEEDKMSTSLEALKFMFSQVKQIIRKLSRFIFVH